MMHACGELPGVSIECGSVLTIRELLLETDMLTLLSRDQLRVEIEAGLHLTLPLLLAIERTIGITTRRDWRPTAPQRDLIAIRSEARRVGKERVSKGKSAWSPDH